jgi:hypothetical protein
LLMGESLVGLGFVVGDCYRFGICFGRRHPFPTPAEMVEA